MNENQINLNYAFDSQGARLERANKRLFIICVILIIALFVTNGLWVFYESQFDTISIEAEQEADGDSNNYVIGGDYGGETESEGN
jgi:hypothetical protein